jgi:hypothetical protein
MVQTLIQAVSSPSRRLMVSVNILITPALLVVLLDSRSSGEDIDSPDSLLSNLKTFGSTEETRGLMNSTETINIDLNGQTDTAFFLSFLDRKALSAVPNFYCPLPI